MMAYTVLAINPGSTSTKLAVYQGKQQICETIFYHPAEILEKYSTVAEQLEMRLKMTFDFLEKNMESVDKLDAVVGRGGVLVPIKSGAYLVTAVMKKRLLEKPLGQHASNLGALMAAEVADKVGINAYIYDGVTVDEMWDIAHVTGEKEITRACRCHALNMRAVAMQTAEKMRKSYAQVNLIVAHLGGGITMSAHEHGRMVDVVLDSEGPLAPERAGRIPSNQLLHFAVGEGLGVQELYKRLRGKGGLVSFFNTSDARIVEENVKKGDFYANLIWNAMAYQIAKGVGELYVTLKGNVDGIVFTGGMSYSRTLMERIIPWLDYLAPVYVEPGEREMEALAQGVMRVLEGKEKAHIYDEKTDQVEVHY